MTQQQRGRPVAVGVGGGGGEKGEIDTASALFPARRSEGIYCGGMMIYVRGGGAVGVRRGTKVRANND